MIKALLDTHMFYWLMEGKKEFGDKSLEKLNNFSEICISSITLWEIFMLEKRSILMFHKPVLLWMEEALEKSGIKIIGMTTPIAFDCVNLPGDFHKDPADRIIVSTARILEAVLFTKDQKIIDYGKHGYVSCF